MDFKIEKIVKNHSIPIMQNDLIAISNIGCLIALLKENTLYIYKLNGEILRMIEIERKNIKFIHWVDENIILIEKKGVKLYNLSQNGFIHQIKKKIIGTNMNKNRILIVTENNFHIYSIINHKFEKIETINYTRAINLFQCIYFFKYKPKKLSETNLIVKKLNIRTFKVKNEIRNLLFFNNNLQNINPSSEKNQKNIKTTFFYSCRSISAIFKNGKLSIFKKNKKIKNITANIKFLEITKYQIYFTSKSYLYIYDFKKLKKNKLKVIFMKKISTGILIVSKKDIFFLQIHNIKKNQMYHICKKINILYQNESIAKILRILKFTKNHEESIELAKIFKISIYDYFDNYFEYLLRSNVHDDSIIGIMKNLLIKYTISKFHGLAFQAYHHNRISLSQYLIVQEMNYDKKLKFLLQYKDNVFITKFISNEIDYNFLHLFFSKMKIIYSANDIQIITRDKVAFKKYKNYIKYFKEEYIEFLEKNNNNEDFIHENLLKSNIDLSLSSKKLFDMKIFQILVKFYTIKKYIFERYEYDATTIDAAIKFLLAKNDKKNVVFLRHNSIMCKEKFEYLKNSLFDF